MTNKKVQSRLTPWTDSPTWTPLIVVESSRQATQRGTEPRQVNIEVHILHVALISTSQRLTDSDSTRYKILSNFFFVIIIIILKIIAISFFYLFLAKLLCDTLCQPVFTYRFQKKSVSFWFTVFQSHCRLLWFCRARLGDKKLQSCLLTCSSGSWCVPACS